MVVSVNSLGLLGVNAYRVLVETDMYKNVPGIEVVGLPDTVVKESKDRVRLALRNTGFEAPNQRITINLAPASVKKAGALYDLPIFVSILSVMGVLPASFEDAAFIGELSLSGQVKPVNGVLPMAICAKETGIKQLFVPYENGKEAAVCEGIEIIPVKDTVSLMRHLRNQMKIPPQPHEIIDPESVSYPVDFSDVMGQTVVKHVMEIAAAGGHNLLLIGSPGAGKSMLASRVPTILPDMTREEMIETTKIHSIAGTLPSASGLVTRRPFRSPHHTISSVGLTGGGSIPRPGEISLAHNGVLFLDELPEFERSTLEILRQPMEEGSVTISRANATITYPSSFMLVAAMNPCPCGYYGHPTRPCICSKKTVSHYLSRISGPLLDRIDLHIEVPPVDYKALSSKRPEESSAVIKERVNRVRQRQNERFRGTGILCNARITPALLQKFCPLDDAANSALQKVFDVLGFSARSYSRILKIARTVADMDESDVIRSRHILEAIQYRSLDRKYWS